MALRGVLFDMGGTLLHYNAPGTTWEDTEKKGARAIYNQLRADNIALPAEECALEIAWEHSLAIWNQIDTCPVEELKLDKWLAQLLEHWGISDPMPEQVCNAAEAYMATIQTHVAPLQGAADTLQALRKRGLRIGLISNTLWPSAPHRYDLERHGLISYLECMIFSADAEVWKPHQDVFQLGLDALGLQASETAYVGDSLYFDIWGAQQAGLRGVWIEQTHLWTSDSLDITPDATVRTLPELVTLVTDWS